MTASARRRVLGGVLATIALLETYQGVDHLALRRNWQLLMTGRDTFVDPLPGGANGLRIAWCASLVLLATLAVGMALARWRVLTRAAGAGLGLTGLSLPLVPAPSVLPPPPGGVVYFGIADGGPVPFAGSYLVAAGCCFVVAAGAAYATVRIIGSGTIDEGVGERQRLTSPERRRVLGWLLVGSALLAAYQGVDHLVLLAQGQVAQANVDGTPTGLPGGLDLLRLAWFTSLALLSGVALAVARRGAVAPAIAGLALLALSLPVVPLPSVLPGSSAGSDGGAVQVIVTLGPAEPPSVPGLPTEPYLVAAACCLVVASGGAYAARRLLRPAPR